MPALPVYNTKGPSYGGFIGYNWQIDDVVFGLELNANRASLNARATNSVTRSYIVVNGSSTYAPTTVNITSTGTADMSTYGTVRGAGLGAGQFSALPRRRHLVRPDRQLAIRRRELLRHRHHASIRQSAFTAPRQCRLQLSFQRCQPRQIYRRLRRSPWHGLPGDPKYFHACRIRISPSRHAQ